jgi:hypothetical protein
MVDDVSFEMLRPQSDPAPCAGYTSTASGSVSSFACSESYSRPAISSAEASAPQARSGRPTSPMNSVSPVSTSRGCADPAVSVTTTHRLSGVWPGVSRKRSRTRPSCSSSPSRTARWGNSAPAAAPMTTVAPVRPASSRCPLTKSACRCVSTT